MWKWYQFSCLTLSKKANKDIIQNVKLFLIRPLFLLHSTPAAAEIKDKSVWVFYHRKTHTSGIKPNLILASCVLFPKLYHLNTNPYWINTLSSVNYTVKTTSVIFLKCSFYKWSSPVNSWVTLKDINLHLLPKRGQHSQCFAMLFYNFFSPQIYVNVPLWDMCLALEY